MLPYVNLALVAGIWMLLAVIFCLVTGRGIAIGQSSGEPDPEPPAAPTPRQFAALAAHEWALAAHNLATDELRSAHLGEIRRVAST